ncbi:hypothetical protein BASA83_013674 [Batrachochytrium salamandrivorans]|nr:hypothetical protein BASA83_013674 [Batrachochytrium salamandrivorans]
MTTWISTLHVVVPLTSSEDNRGLVKDSAVCADGDSFLFTHRTVPLQLHIGKHVETATFYVTDLCHGLFGYSWLERHNPRINWENPPTISKTFELPLAPNTILIPVDLSPISCSLSDSISLESMQSDVSLCRDQAETLPTSSFRLLELTSKPASEPFHARSTLTHIHYLDLRGAYNLLRIRRGDDSKTSFITKYGQFEFLVMPFGLANAPAQFQRHENSLFRDVIGKACSRYLDDIVIYSDNMMIIAQVQNVLRVLQDNGLYCKAESAIFTSRR